MTPPTTTKLSEEEWSKTTLKRPTASVFFSDLLEPDPIVNVVGLKKRVFPAAAEVQVNKFPKDVFEEGGDLEVAVAAVACGRLRTCAGGLRVLW
jgi:hypothetical protein